jgi:hypothetical protein
LYGLCEGRRIGLQFERALEENGFRITRVVETADIILTHSGGCFALPDKHSAQLVIFLGLPFWPGKSTLHALAQKILLDTLTWRSISDILHGVRKTCWNGVYFWNIVNNHRMLRGRKVGGFWQSTDLTVLIRNKDDTMCVPGPSAFHFHNPPVLLELQGQHDDCWSHPDKYLAIIKVYYGKLLAQAK